MCEIVPDREDFMRSRQELPPKITKELEIIYRYMRESENVGFVKIYGKDLNISERTIDILRNKRYIVKRYSNWNPFWILECIFCVPEDMTFVRIQWEV